ncbi:MAG: MinD/ParA family protein [Alphaproteobacteria bacterium]|nr:MinD/ParA family protein [Alphaproteobacteria bacterium]TAD91583.1 MAG: MinD/ParA family protein [Alphaproteobacteria bacterium]
MTSPPASTGSPETGRTGNLIAIASGKGGVGKTFFAITFTHALARQGRKVLLFDGDLGLANVDVQLGLMPNRDLGGVITGRLTLSQAKTAYPTAGFDVIAGRSGTGSLAALAPSRLAVLGSDLATLARSYDHVVMDLGAGVDRMVRQLAGFASRRLVVVTPEPTSLTDAYAFIKITIADDPTADLRIVVNQARTQAEGDRTYATLLKACESFLRYTPPLAGVVRRDRRVIECIRAQTPLLSRFSTSDAAVDIQAIAQKLGALGT